MSGLRGNGLVLQINEGDDRSVATDGKFTFATSLPNGAAYQVAVAHDPSHRSQTCKVTSGSTSRVDGGNVQSVRVECTTNRFSIGVSVAGLDDDESLTLHAGDDDLTADANDSFDFATQLEDGSEYEITLGDLPPGKVCTLGDDAVGVLDGDDVDVSVTCRWPVSCLELQDAQPATESGDFAIDPDGDDELDPITAYCDMGTDGGGYTYYAVTDGESSNGVDQPNACQKVGLQLVVPRTLAHLSAMYNKYGAGYFATVPGVFAAEAGQSLNGFAMRSSDAAASQSWNAIDGGVWFVRDVPSAAAEGNYTPGCWLAVRGLDEHGLVFDGQGCDTFTGTHYLCSDNAKP